MKPMIDSQEFLLLSARINYQLSGVPINWDAVLALMFGDREIPDDEDREVLLETLEYLGEAYGPSKRKLGPSAILHPIRAAAILIRVCDNLTILDVLTTLLHDKDEDLVERKFEPELWKSLTAKYKKIVTRLKHDDEWFLNERIAILAIKSGEMYYNYLGRMLENAKNIPDLVKVKLADRLDNTYDMRIDLEDKINKINFYRIVFDTLFVNAFKGIDIHEKHPVERKINEAVRLHQLYKNVVLLSLLRRERKDSLDTVTERLFKSLAKASIVESNNVFLHIFGHHIQNTMEIRRVIQEVKAYCQQGGILRITPSREGNELDGIFKLWFDYADKRKLNESLAKLFSNHRLMAKIALIFTAIFSSFLNDPQFRVGGVRTDGIHDGNQI
jgi:hypothetical protein